MKFQVPPTVGGAPIGPADLALPPTQPVDLTAILLAQTDRDETAPAVVAEGG